MSLGRLGLVQAGSPDKQCPTLAELTADATATASQIAEGATAYVQGEKITGTMPTTIDVAAAGIKLGYSTFEKVPSYFDFSKLTFADSMFRGCRSVTSFSGLNFSKVTNAPNMFAECSSVTSFSGLDFPEVTNANAMFNGCSSVTSFSGLDFPKLTSADSMFRGCSSVTSIGSFNFSNVKNTNNMFYGCTNLTTIGNIIFLQSSLSLADSPNLDKDTLILFGTIASGPGDFGLAALKTLGLPAQTITFNTAAQEFLESEGIVAKLTDENWTVNFA